MDIQEYMKNKKELYYIFISMIESENIEQENYQKLIDYIDEKKILENHEEFKLFLHLISEVYKNHRFTRDFLQKIEQFIIQISGSIKQTFTNSETFDIFKNNKRILLFLFTEKIIEITDSIVHFILKKSSVNGTNYCHFFFNEIKDSVDDVFRETIKREFLEIDPNIFNNFDEKRKIGENDSYICELIRNDSIKEFVIFVNKTNLNLSSQVHQSIFETNPYLMKNQPTLIEYSAFFGSIQIFKYLQLSKVKLTSSLWIYSIHGNNPEIIHLLEENNIKPDDKTYEKCLEESIKCHHNDIANYFLNNSIKFNDENYNTENNFDTNIIAYSFHFYNYEFFPDDFNCKFIFYYACQFNYITLVELLLKSEKVDINAKITRKAVSFINTNRITSDCFFNDVLNI